MWNKKTRGTFKSILLLVPLSGGFQSGVSSPGNREKSTLFDKEESRLVFPQNVLWSLRTFVERTCSTWGEF